MGVLLFEDQREDPLEGYQVNHLTIVSGVTKGYPWWVPAGIIKADKQRLYDFGRRSSKRKGS